MASNTPRLDKLEKNLIINGNFDFWQRATSSSTLAGYTTADRWRSTGTVGGFSYSISQSTDVPTQIQSGFQSLYSMIVLATGNNTFGSTNWHSIRYAMEGQDYQEIHGRNYRIQFWVKASKTGTMSVALQNGASTRYYIATVTVNSANTWEKKFVDIPAESTSSGYSFDNTAGLYIFFVTGSGSGQYGTVGAWSTGSSVASSSQTNFISSTADSIKIAQVSLIPQDFTQAGITTTDISFQRCGRNISHELQMCQRYFEKTYDLATNPGAGSPLGSIYLNYGGTTSGLRRTGVNYKVSKRTAATVTVYSSTGTSGSITTEDSSGSTATDVAATVVLTTENGFMVSPNSATITAPGLRVHYAADAEL